MPAPHGAAESLDASVSRVKRPRPYRGGRRATIHPLPDPCRHRTSGKRHCRSGAASPDAEFVPGGLERVPRTGLTQVPAHPKSHGRARIPPASRPGRTRPRHVLRRQATVCVVATIRSVRLCHPTVPALGTEGGTPKRAGLRRMPATGRLGDRRRREGIAAHANGHRGGSTCRDGDDRGDPRGLARTARNFVRS